MPVRSVWAPAAESLAPTPPADSLFAVPADEPLGPVPAAVPLVPARAAGTAECRAIRAEWPRGTQDEARRPAAGGAAADRAGHASTCRSRTSTGRSTTWSRADAGRGRAARRPGQGRASPGSWSDGWLLERARVLAARRKAGLPRRLVSAERVLDPEVARLARAVADRYAGSLSDVLRLAVPPRHARVERQPDRARRVPPAATPVPLRGCRCRCSARPARRRQACRTRATPPDGQVAGYPAGDGFLAGAGATGGRPAAVWSALPGEDWPARIAEAAAATVRGGRGVVVVVADARDLDRLDAALTAALGGAGGTSRSPRRSARPSGTGGSSRPPAIRCRWWSVRGRRCSRRSPTRAGGDLGRRRRPARRAAGALPARAGGAAHPGPARRLRPRSSAGIARTAEAQLLLETGWAPRDRGRPGGPACAYPARGADRRRPAAGPRSRRGDRPAAQPGLAGGARPRCKADAPVLVQVPRRGYLPSVACADCRTPARCPHCAGPLGAALGARACRTAAGAGGWRPTTPARTAAAGGCARR